MNQLVKQTKNPEAYLSETELIIRTVTEDWLDKYARDLCSTSQHNDLVESIHAQLRDNGLIKEIYAK